MNPSISAVTPNKGSVKTFNAQKVVDEIVRRTVQGPYSLKGFAVRFKLTDFDDTMAKYKEVIDAAKAKGEDMSDRMNLIWTSTQQKKDLTAHLVIYTSQEFYCISAARIAGANR
jgi:hypothetical protein